jgi:hypothetical protein
LIFATAVIVLIATILVLLNQKSNNGPDGLTKVKSYHYVEDGQITCQAISAECGVCFGEVIEKSCYVHKDKLDNFQRNAMGL